MQLIFIIGLIMPISILHLCNTFFFNKVYKLNYNLYFISFTFFYGLIGWLFFFVSYFELINFQFINFFFLIIFLISLIILFYFKYYRFIFKIKKLNYDIKISLILFVCIFVIIGDLWRAGPL